MYLILFGIGCFAVPMFMGLIVCHNHWGWPGFLLASVVSGLIAAATHESMLGFSVLAAVTVAYPFIRSIEAKNRPSARARLTRRDEYDEEEAERQRRWWNGVYMNELDFPDKEKWPWE